MELEHVADILKFVAFAAILGITLYVTSKVKAGINIVLEFLRTINFIHRFFGTRNMDTDDHGRVIELTQYSIPDWLLIWIWFPALLRIYLWPALATAASWIDARFQQLPIDPWNRAGSVLKAAFDSVDEGFAWLEAQLEPVFWAYYIPAGLLVLYVAYRLYRQLRIRPATFLGAFLMAAGIGIGIAYIIGFTLGGAFGIFRRLGFTTETIVFSNPWESIVAFGKAFLDHPLQQAVWVAFGWWFVMSFYCNVYRRRQYVPASKELREVDCWGLGGRLLNVLPPLKTVDIDGNSSVPETARPRVVKLEWRNCGFFESFFLLGGMAFYDSEYVPGSVKPQIKIGGFPKLFFTVVRYNKHNAVLASERADLAGAEKAPGPKKQRIRRAFAGLRTWGGRAGRYVGGRIGQAIRRPAPTKSTPVSAAPKIAATPDDDAPAAPATKSA